MTSGQKHAPRQERSAQGCGGQTEGKEVMHVVLKCNQVVLIETTAWMDKKPLSKCWGTKNRGNWEPARACGELCRIAHKNTFNLTTFK